MWEVGWLVVKTEPTLPLYLCTLLYCSLSSTSDMSCSQNGTEQRRRRSLAARAALSLSAAVRAATYRWGTCSTPPEKEKKMRSIFLFAKN